MHKRGREGKKIDSEQMGRGKEEDLNALTRKMEKSSLQKCRC